MNKAFFYMTLLSILTVPAFAQQAAGSQQSVIYNSQGLAMPTPGTTPLENVAPVPAQPMPHIVLGAPNEQIMRQLKPAQQMVKGTADAQKAAADAQMQQNSQATGDWAATHPGAAPQLSPETQQILKTMGAASSQ